MSVQHLTIDDTRAWFQAGDHDVYVGDVLDVITSPSTRVRFARYGRGAMHEWMVTVDETLIVTKGALMVRSAGQVQIARAGEVISLTKGTLVVYRGEADLTGQAAKSQRSRDGSGPLAYALAQHDSRKQCLASHQQRERDTADR